MTLTGGKRGESDWIKFVKKVQNDEGISFREAMSKASILRKKEKNGKMKGGDYTDDDSMVDVGVGDNSGSDSDLDTETMSGGKRRRRKNVAKKRKTKKRKTKKRKTKKRKTKKRSSRKK